VRALPPATLLRNNVQIDDGYYVLLFSLNDHTLKVAAKNLFNEVGYLGVFGQSAQGQSVVFTDDLKVQSDIDLLINAVDPSINLPKGYLPVPGG
jgi:hypothetical protein